MTAVFASVGMSLDGFIAGPNAGPDNNLGDGGARIHQWMLQRRTAVPGTRRGRTSTARDRWPARGCSRPPAPPTAWRCRPPPRRCLLAFVGVSERTLVHCSPQTDSGRE